MINHKTFTRKKLNSPETTQSRTNLERSFSMIWMLWGFEFGSICNPDPLEPSSCWCSSLPCSPQNLYRQRPLNPTMQPSIFFPSAESPSFRCQIFRFWEMLPLLPRPSYAAPRARTRTNESNPNPGSEAKVHDIPCWKLWMSTCMLYASVNT